LAEFILRRSAHIKSFLNVSFILAIPTLGIPVHDDVKTFSEFFVVCEPYLGFPSTKSLFSTISRRSMNSLMAVFVSPRKTACHRERNRVPIAKPTHWCDPIPSFPLSADDYGPIRAESGNRCNAHEHPSGTG
jgi:hypothetical protein